MSPRAEVLVYVVLRDVERGDREDEPGSEGHFEAVFATRQAADDYVAEAGAFCGVYVEEHILRAASETP